MDSQNGVPQTRSLPTIEEVYEAIDDLYGNKPLVKKLNGVNLLVNANPKKEWLHDHPIATRETTIDGQRVTVPIKYIPIGIVEYLLTFIYIKWRFEIKEVKLIANSLLTIGRLHVLDPSTGQWDWQDGEGAVPIQTKKGSYATDFENILNDAVMKAAPASESYAIKDAAEKFGRIFGKDLNREYFSDYKALNTKFANAVPEDIISQINKIEETDELAQLYTAHPEFHLNRDFMKILNARKTELDVRSNINA